MRELTCAKGINQFGDGWSLFCVFIVSALPCACALLFVTNA